jgi:hypothetical protein
MKESQKIKINGIVRYQARYLNYVQVEDHSFLRLSVSTTSIELHDSAKITFVVCVIHAQAAASLHSSRLFRAPDRLSSCLIIFIGREVAWTKGL